jgi:hypothetical protein
MAQSRRVHGQERRRSERQASARGGEYLRPRRRNGTYDEIVIGYAEGVIGPVVTDAADSPPCRETVRADLDRAQRRTSSKRQDVVDGSYDETGHI